MIATLKQLTVYIHRLIEVTKVESRILRSKIRGRDLLPLVAVLPLVIYACLFQMVVCHRSEQDESSARSRYAYALAHRLEMAAEDDNATCRDYAHWSELYDQMPHLPDKWIESNMDAGIAVSFGFDMVVLEDKDGNDIWSSGFSRELMSDVSNYCQKVRKSGNVDESGLLHINGRTYSFTAVSIRRSDHKGESRGLLFAARKITPSLLSELAGGSNPKLAFIENSGDVISSASLGRSDILPSRVVGLLAGDGKSKKAFVEISRDHLQSYACIPLTDIAGNPAGTLVDVSSREAQLSSLQALKRMSLALIILCLLIAVSGTIYLRTRDTAIRAHRDELTGLYNHRYLQERLRLEMQNAARSGQNLSVIMIDVDHFKVVNDTFGHSIGDRVLQTVASEMLGAVRQNDVVARYGGEEFVVVLPQTSLRGALVVAERLRENVQRCVVKSHHKDSTDVVPVEVRFTISAGVASFPEDGINTVSLIDAADTAMSSAKRTRNAVVSYRDTLRDWSSQDTTTTNSMDGFLRDPSLMVVRPLVAAIDTRAPGSANHSENTAQYAVAIGRELGFSTQDLNLTCRAALLHDVGNVGIPDALLSKQERLSHQEFEIIRKHSRLGADILSKSPLLSSAAEIVLDHHERFDGTGYPRGISGEDIPLIARVIAVADAIDAMLSNRCYKNALSLEESLEELVKQSGHQFDPQVVQAAEAVIRKMIRNTSEYAPAA